MLHVTEILSSQRYIQCGEGDSNKTCTLRAEIWSDEFQTNFKIFLTLHCSSEVGLTVVRSKTLVLEFVVLVF